MTITGNRASRSVKMSNGTTKSFPAYSTTFVQDEAGKWSTLGYAVIEADVIDSLSKCKNWTEIRAAHFPMHGFHA